MKFIMGVDPGLDGAVAVISERGHLSIKDMPVKTWGKGKRELNYKRYLEILKNVSESCSMVYIERVASMPNQGVVSTFKFGQTFGAQTMGLVAVGLTYRMVSPQTWKAMVGCTADKESSVEKCLELFGDEYRHLWFGERLGIMDGRCEAALIAHYGRKFRE